MFFLVLVIGIALQALQRVSGSGSLPSCGDDDTQQLLKSAFDQSQFARSENLSLVEASDITDLHSADKSKRLCHANISLNNALTAQIKYQLEPRGGGQFMLTFEAD